MDKRDRVVPLVLNPAQVLVTEREEDLLRTKGQARLYVLKARQAGFSTREQAKNLHVPWSNPRVKTMTLCDTRENTDRIFNITQTAIQEFPEGLLWQLGKAQAKEVGFPNFGSRFWTQTAGSKTGGRGLTLRRLHGSEFAWWTSPMATLGRVQPTLERPGTAIVLETTASGNGSEAHEFWVDSQNGTTGYEAIFIPWWECDPVLYRSPLDAPDELGQLEPEEQHLVDRFSLDLEQIKWRRTKMATYGRAYFLQEYAEDPETCWMVAGNLFYDADVLKYLQDRAKDPIRQESVHVRNFNGQVHIYRDQPGFEWERERVIFGVDTAEGVEGDRSAWVARTFPSWHLLETFADSTVEPKALAALLADRGRKYGNAFMVVEKNAHGITVLRELRDDHGYPSSRLYHRTEFDQASKMPKKKIGWATTGETKPLLLDAGSELFLAARDGSVDVPAREAIRDGFRVVRDENGRADLNGRDLLVAEMLAWQGRSSSSEGYSSFTEAI